MLIGIGHRSRHGKDQFAAYMVQYLNAVYPELSVRKLSWAWKLKDVCHQLYGHLGLKPPEYYETEPGISEREIKLPRINKTPVEIWIDMGTPAVRDQVWDNTWLDWVQHQSSLYDIVICPDTRFTNEALACDYTIRVYNPRIPNRTGKTADNHLEGYEFDYNVINDMGLSELRGQAYQLTSRMMKERVACTH
jgi:hypothetical protein